MFTDSSDVYAIGVTILQKHGCKRTVEALFLSVCSTSKCWMVSHDNSSGVDKPESPSASLMLLKIIVCNICNICNYLILYISVLSHILYFVVSCFSAEYARLPALGCQGSLLE